MERLSYLASLGQTGPWHFGSLLPDWISDLCRLTFGIALLQTGVRARYTLLASTVGASPPPYLYVCFGGTW